MNRFALFNIGFRSEGISRAISDYEKKNSIDDFILEDSREIIMDALKFKNKIIDSFNSSKNNPLEFFPLIFKVFKDRNAVDIYSELNEILLKLEMIKRKEKSDFTKVIDFFESLSLVCLENSNPYDYSHFMN